MNKFFATLGVIGCFLLAGCAQNQHACGSKAQKKAAYKKAKSGKAPGGNMLK
jgi:hypothetical protein